MTWNRWNQLDRALFFGAGVFLLAGLGLFFTDWDGLGFSGSKAPILGQLKQTQGDVRKKASVDFKWTKVKNHPPILDGDRIFTGEESKAWVTLNEGESIQIDPNSFVIFTKKKGELKLLLSFGNVQGPKSLIDKLVVHETELKKRPSSPRTRILMTELAPLPEENTIMPAPALPAVVPVAPIQAKTPAAPAPKPRALSKSRPTPRPQDRPSVQPNPAQANRTPRLNGFTWPNSKPKDIFVFTPLRKEFTVGPAPVPNADRYETQISLSPDFQAPLTKTHSTSQMALQDLPGRIFFLRTRALGPGGATSWSPQQRVIVVSSPPHLQAPAELVRRARTPADEGEPRLMDLNWNKIPMADAYEVQWSHDAEFKADIRNSTISATSTQIELPKSGEYYVRVRALESKAPFSGFSPPKKVHYRLGEPLDTPAPREPASEWSLIFQKGQKTPFFLSWDSTDRATQYELEVANDPDFKSSLFSVKTQRPQFLMNRRIPTGVYFWRVRAEDPQGYSVWSESRKFQIYALGGDFSAEELAK